MHADSFDVPPLAPPLLVITGDDGLCAVVDAVAQYLADNHTAAPRAIAALVKTLPHRRPAVDLGSCHEALGFVSSLPGAKPGRTHAAGNTDTDIVYVYAAVDGVEFVARERRPVGT